MASKFAKLHCMSSQIDTNRRQFLSALVGGAAGFSVTYRAFAQNAPAPIKATKLSDTVALLAGDGGNVGVVMSDGGLPERANDLLKAASEVDSHKVSLLYNTHWHFDHTGSNETLGKMGVKIMAHENVKK